MENDSGYRTLIVKLCTTKLTENIAQRFLNLSKKIIPKSMGGDLFNAFFLLKDLELYNKLFVEVSSMYGDECDTFGQKIYKLVEAFTKLYGLIEFVENTDANFISLIFDIFGELVKHIIADENDKTSYIAIMTQFKLLLFIYLKKRFKHKSLEVI